jgi:hypothetical protein
MAGPKKKNRDENEEEEEEEKESSTEIKKNPQPTIRKGKIRIRHAVLCKLHQSLLRHRSPTWIFRKCPHATNSIAALETSHSKPFFLKTFQGAETSRAYFFLAMISDMSIVLLFLFGDKCEEKENGKKMDCGVPAPITATSGLSGVLEDMVIIFAEY